MAAKMAAWNDKVHITSIQVRQQHEKVVYPYDLDARETISNIQINVGAIVDLKSKMAAKMAVNIGKMATTSHLCKIAT